MTYQFSQPQPPQPQPQLQAQPQPQPYAGQANAAIGARVIAYLIDGACLTAGVALASVFLFLDLPILFVLFYLAVVAAYFVALGKWRTPGMMVAGIRLVRINVAGNPVSGPPGIWRAVLRGVVFSLGSSIAVGPFSPLFDGRGAQRGWHDKASSTWMVTAKADAPTFGTGSADAVPASPGLPFLAPPSPFSAPLQTAQLDTVFAPGRNGVESARQNTSAHPGVISDAPGFASHQPSPPPAPQQAAQLDTVIAPGRAGVDPARQNAYTHPGVISDAPGFASSQPSRSAPPAPQQTLPLPPAPLPTVPPQAEDDIDLTRATLPKRLAEQWLLRLDTGIEFLVNGDGFIGRNPQSPDARPAQLISYPDDTKSISKTHLSFGVDGTRLWATDRRSTNGTSIIRAGQEDVVVGTDAPTYLEAGDILALGDRRISVATR